MAHAAPKATKTVYHPALGRIELSIAPGKTRVWLKVFSETKGQSWSHIRYDYSFVNFVFREEWKVRQNGLKSLLERWRAKYIGFQLTNVELSNCVRFALCIAGGNIATMEMIAGQWDEEAWDENMVELLHKTLFKEAIGGRAFHQLRVHLTTNLQAHRLSIRLKRDLSKPRGFQLVLDKQKKTRKQLNRQTDLHNDVMCGAIGFLHATDSEPIRKIQEMKRTLKMVQGKDGGFYGTKGLNPGSVAVKPFLVTQART